jgi:hypothetical protein
VLLLPSLQSIQHLSAHAKWILRIFSTVSILRCNCPPKAASCYLPDSSCSTDYRACPCVLCLALPPILAISLSALSIDCYSLEDVLTFAAFGRHLLMVYLFCHCPTPTRPRYRFRFLTSFAAYRTFDLACLMIIYLDGTPPLSVLHSKIPYGFLLLIIGPQQVW